MLGLLLINKPSGITSFGAVAKIKRLSGEKRVGHTGTLDPMATGVLPILLGRATTLSSYLLNADKSYNACIRLGTVTDTGDITGNIISKSSVSCDNDDVIRTLEGFIGIQEQVPPMYSAIKQNGVRLYELARRGETAQIPVREIEVFSLNQTSRLNDNLEFDIETTVSKGTYIRALCRDIGESLGTGATLSALCRTKTAGFTLDMCVDLDNLTSENIGDYILPADRAVQYMTKLTVTEKQAVRFSNGGKLSLDRLKTESVYDGQLFRVYCGDRFLGIGRADIHNNQLNISCIIQTYN